ncbi:hypothetical protein OF83DRAFT_1083676 [Amylostereum chailletii]|nr:hypothetical protein OF83DRAFT_1083676 [Amylostereum chailletii]
MNWSSSTLATLSSDTEPSILITFENAKYIFNVPENTTRSVLQSRKGWRKLKGMFLTQAGTQRASGLPGMLMSVADASPRKIDVVGPPGTLHLLASMRLYTFRNSLCVKVNETLASPLTEVEPQPIFKDDNITAYSFPISSTPSCSNLKRKRGVSPDSPCKRPTKTVDTFVPGTERLNPAIPALSSTARIDPLASPEISPPSTLLDHLREDPYFSPTPLEGAEAQEWRRHVVDHMFTWIEPPPEPKKKGKKGKGTDKVAGTDPSVLPLPQIPHWVATGGTTPQGRGTMGSPNPGGSRELLPPFIALETRQTHAYVVVGPRVRGKFDATRAKELGLEGPNRGLVAGGKTVTFTVKNKDGTEFSRTVKPEDCVGPQENPSVVIVLDVPTPDHIESLSSTFSTPFYAEFRSKTEDVEKRYNVHLIYHLLGKGVLEDERYRDFMCGFADNVHHLVAAPEFCPDPVTFTSAAFSQLRLNQLDPEFFPPIHFNTSPTKSLEDIPGLPSNVAVLKANMIIDVRPGRPPVLDELALGRDKFHPAVSSDTTWKPPPDTLKFFNDAQTSVRAAMSERADKAEEPGSDLIAIPLGTSSAVTSRYRNVSGLLVQLPDHGSVLLDAGEGTWGQLARFFGTESSRPNNVWDELRRLKCIFISHAHADHHVGLAKILAMRKQLEPPPTEPLYLVAGFAVQLYLREYSNLEDFGFADLPTSEKGIITIINDHVHYKRTLPDSKPSFDAWKSPENSRVAVQALCNTLGLESLRTVDVAHRTKAHGLIMTHRDGWRLVYSGDTMPTQKLVNAGQNATLLIHEATMGDDQEEMAKEKAHSTVGQAVSIGEQMNAKNLILTHFSNRYPHMPDYLAKKNAGGPTVALAFDHARMRVGDLWRMPLYLRAIEKSFQDTSEEGDEEEEQDIMAAHLVKSTM